VATENEYETFAVKAIIGDMMKYNLDAEHDPGEILLWINAHAETEAVRDLLEVVGKYGNGKANIVYEESSDKTQHCISVSVEYGQRDPIIKEMARFFPPLISHKIESARKDARDYIKMVIGEFTDRDMKLTINGESADTFYKKLK